MVKFEGSDFMAIFGIFIGAIIALVLIANIADATNQDNTVVVNETFVPSTTTNGSVNIVGRAVVGTPVISNGTDLVVLGNNFSFASELQTDGLLGISVTSLDGAPQQGFNGGNASSLNLTYTYIPDGSVGATSSAIVLLIKVIAALAIVVFMIVMLFKGPLKNLLGNTRF